MGTRSMIGKRNADGTITAIYCHWDGYPAGVGEKLCLHYTDPAKIDALLALGQISSLREEIGDPTPEMPHDFDHPRDTWTIAYHRDRGEDLIIETVPTMEDWPALASDSWAEYVYLWDGVAWQHAELKGNNAHARFTAWELTADAEEATEA